jgi:hypothetical protein
MPRGSARHRLVSGSAGDLRVTVGAGPLDTAACLGARLAAGSAELAGPVRYSAAIAVVAVVACAGTPAGRAGGRGDARPDGGGMVSTAMVLGASLVMSGAPAVDRFGLATSTAWCSSRYSRHKKSLQGRRQRRGNAHQVHRRQRPSRPGASCSPGLLLAGTENIVAR